MVFQVVGIAVLFGLICSIVLFWPRRREIQITNRCLIQTPPERIWDIYVINLDHPVSAAFYEDTASARTVQDDPKIIEQVLHLSGGQRRELGTLRHEVLVERRPEICVTRLCDAGGEPYPHGKNQADTVELVQTHDGTQVAMSWRGEVENFFQHLVMLFFEKRQLDKLRKFSESNDAGTLEPAGKFPWKTLAFSALAVASFALLLGWIVAILLVAILVIHEFGHWLAMRMTGQPAPRIMLIPFLGGVAIANHPHKTLFDDAFCALMGPMISILPCAILAIVASTVAPSVTTLEEWISLFKSTDRQVQLAALIFPIMALIGLLNTLQLLPVLPLDGGQVLRAVIKSISTKWARWILLAITTAGLAVFVHTGDFILAAILGLGVLQAWYMNDETQPARPMGGGGIAVIGLGYLITLTVHVAATLYGLQAFGALW